MLKGFERGRFIRSMSPRMDSANDGLAASKDSRASGSYKQATIC